jgi:hypothetical protein
MMKKMTVAMMMILVAALCCFAETHTITLVSRVEKLDAQYVIRNNETGAVGASVVYTTGEIAKHDVRTSFDILQSCDSNGYNVVKFTVEATELRAVVNNKLYSTEGVSILMDGVKFGSSVSFERTTVGCVAAGTTVASFEVIWSTNSNLVDAVYEASVTLTATAL